MREIKFRAWDKENKKMVKWNDVDSNKIYALTIWGNPFSYSQKQSPFKHWYEDLYLMQFTGLKDLHKKEVYDGDIFTFRCPHCIKQHTAKIFWIDDLGCWGLDDGNQQAPLMIPEINEENGEMEGNTIMTIEQVIGNIYENPELLK